MTKVATTNQTEKLAGLLICAISLLHRGNRNEQQTQEVFDALAKFLGEKPVQIETQQSVYPGRNANHCAGCGDFIDEGGMCNCGTDHWTLTPGPHAKTIPVKMSHQDQQLAMITVTGKAIDLVRQGKKNEAEITVLLEQLQKYKDAQSQRNFPHCGNPGGNCEAPLSSYPWD